MPVRGQRAGRGIPVADDTHDQQVGLVECGAVGLHQGIAQFAPSWIDPVSPGDVAEEAARQ